MVRTMLVVTGLLALSGCAAFLATSEESYYHAEVFAPRRTGDQVEVFRQGAPRTPYVVLGRIVATQGMFGSQESVLAELRSRAARMGADALVDLRYGRGARRDDTDSASSSEPTNFNQEGNVSTTESWTQDSKASIRLTISALAIRYQSP